MGKNVSTINELSLPPGNYVLVLPGWYPSRFDAFTGDFNQRQVLATGLYTPQVVLYIRKDKTGTLRSIETTFVQQGENVVEIIVLYPMEKWKVWDAVQSHTTYIKLLYYYAEVIRKKWGVPMLLHAYIVIRGGLGGWLLSTKWKLPFILSEHWTIYFANDPGFIKKRNILFRWLVERVYSRIAHFLPVSASLGNQVQQLYGSVAITVVPNVVDTSQFFFRANDDDHDVFRWVHISTMEYQKNPEGLLRAFATFHKATPGTVLTMVGPYPVSVKQYAIKLGLEKAVEFTGSIAYHEVAQWLKRSHALVLFSRYENLPCVILEALCCGKPVISTKVGGIAEVIDASNGILVSNENEEQLVNAFEQMHKNYDGYDRKKIAETSIEHFSYSAVGSSIAGVYQRVLND